MKKILLLWFSFFSCISMVHGQEVVLQSPYSIFYNLNENTILFENNSEEEIAIASLTKIMTTIVAIEHIDSLENTVVLTPDVFYGLKEADASVAEFKIGQKVTYLDLLYGAMLPSGADATRALAIFLSGSEKNFVVWMNEKASQLGLVHTHYMNTSGLDVEGHYSTVKDVAAVLKYALQNETFRKIFTTKEYITSDKTLHFKSTLLKMQDKYHIDTSSILGAKTGFTNHAGSCLASISKKDGVEYLLVTAGIDANIKQPLHILDAMNVYQYYDSHYGYYPIVENGEIYTTLKVNKSTISTLDVVAPDTVYAFLNLDDLELQTEYLGLKEVDSKVSKGSKIGEFIISNHGDVIKVIDVTMPITLKASLSSKILPYCWILLLIFGFCIFMLGRRKYDTSRNN